MAKKPKPEVEFTVYLPKSTKRKKACTIGTIHATSAKEAVINFKNGQGKCFCPSILTNPTLSTELRAHKSRKNYRIFFYTLFKDKKIKITVGFAYAHSAEQALTALSHGQGRLVMPEAYQSELLRDTLQAEIV